jgi:uncharacterized membrane protein
MKKAGPKQIGTFLVLAAAGFLFFNSVEQIFRSAEILPVSAWLVTPFVLLLLAIAIVPFLDRHWWERNYPIVAFSLGAVVVAYYAVALHNIPRMLLTFYE